MTALSSEHLKRYRDITWLLWKHGRSDWVQSAGLDKKIESGNETYKENGATPESLADDLESLGPTYIKVGQLLASRGDILPPAYLDALARLQDDVEDVPYEDIEKVLVAELDGRPSRIFSEIDESPLAAASLAQVHAAKLRDGTPVVIKVQRPNIEDRIRVDFEAFASIAKLLAQTSVGNRYDVEALVEEFRRTILQELDYREEAQNLNLLRKNLSEFKLIHVPKPILDFCSGRVLTMERCEGISVADISPVIFTEVKGEALADQMFSAYLKQILVDGFFHADPHPGNVLLDRQHRLALIDLGMVGRVNQTLRQQLLNLLLAVSEGHADDAAEIARHIGEQTKRFDRAGFDRAVTELVLKNYQRSVGDMQVGSVVLSIQGVAADYGLQLPSGLALVGKTLLNLDAIARKIAPEFNPTASVRRHASELVDSRMRERLTLGSIFQSTLEMTDIATKLPKRLNDLLTQIGGQGIKLEVDAFEEVKFIRGLHKVANRITAGLLLAAMIIGAALIMNVETQYKLLGYPAFAIVLFVGAAVGAAILLGQIFLNDKKDEDL